MFEKKNDVYVFVMKRRRKQQHLRQQETKTTHREIDRENKQQFLEKRINQE